jgi:hypothetical protein
MIMKRHLSYLAKYGKRYPYLANMVLESIERVRDAGKTKNKIRITAARSLHHATMTYVLLVM